MYRTTVRENVIFYMFFFLFLLSVMEDYHSYALTTTHLAQWRHLLTRLKSQGTNWFFALALFASDKSLAICVFLQVLWHPVSISVLRSCDSCVSEVADRLTETVQTLNISTQKSFFFWPPEVERKTFSSSFWLEFVLHCVRFYLLEKDSARHCRLNGLCEWVCACSCTGGLRFS